MNVKQKVPTDATRSSLLKGLLCLAVYLFALPISAWAETPYEKIWLNQLGSSERESAAAIAADRDGNLFVTGETNGSLDEGTTNWGSSDIYLAKFRGDSGEKLWLRQFGVPGNDGPYGMTIDRNGDVIMVGYTQGTLVPNAPSSQNNLFIARFSGNTGEQIWLKQFGNALLDHAWDMVLDEDNNLFVTGWTEGSLGEHPLGGRDIFLAKFSASTGALIWVECLGSEGYDTGTSVAVDNRGSVFLAGTTMGALEEGKPPRYGLSVFLMKINARTGGTVWIRQPEDLEHVASIVLSADGDILLTGSTPLYLAKFSSKKGEQLWVTRLPVTEGGAYPRKAEVDCSGNILITGYTYGAIDGNDFVGSGDAFLAKFSGATGTKLWVQQFGTAGFDSGNGLVVAAEGSVFMTGVTEGALQEGEPGGGSSDFFLAKFKAPPPPSPFEQIEEIIAHFDQGVAAGTITGSGNAQSAESKEKALREQLRAAEKLIAERNWRLACLLINKIYAKMDELPNPPDFVQGPGVASIASDILLLRGSLGCVLCTKQ